ncbi:glycosyltransferase [Actinomadura sp. KC216]|uniref:glycosyltransferase family 2 protein n=1 Tax=Actinomadura sp. KC216 TaxID=2530370 RepID=UPI00104AA69C|nr:glycosyltransferase [Actinomadura sp. KC216]TDB91502.1 glycosyltransferase [Actinomadura sp. KC216]
MPSDSRSSGGAGGRPPTEDAQGVDVTVVVAVYNTMPYLTDCLNSLVGQSIGAGRMEVIAVDDGSTDGSEAELDRFAEEHPDVMTVLRQPNSGGPGAPSNRALDVAKGRYVYFVGADDHLGREALERMVDAADAWGSDVLVGKMMGVNGREVRQDLFAENRADVDLFDSPLPWLLSNCKLFRRDLVERHKLRFPEDMPIGSDQPFTIEACVRAERISVLADYTCYYAMLRDDGGNITQGSVEVYTRLACAERLFEFVAGLLEPGPGRDAIVHRHAKWELTKPIREGLLELDGDKRRDVCTRVGALVEKYVSDDVMALLPVKRRVRLRLAQRGDVDRLCEAIRADAAEKAYAVTMKNGRAYLAYEGFEDAEAGLPDEDYEITKGLRRRLGEQVRAVGARHADGILEITVRTPITGPDARDPEAVGLAFAVRGRDGRVRLDEASGAELDRTHGDDGALTLTVRMPKPVVFASGSAKRTLRLMVRASGETHDVAVPAGLSGPCGSLVWRRIRPYRLSVRGDARGITAIETRPSFPVRAVVRRLRRALHPGNAASSGGK